MNAIIANELRQAEDDLPYLVQGSIAPCFKGAEDTDSKLLCASGCGQILVENYETENYVNVGIKCFNCGNVTRTPGLSPGEVFATSILSLGENGNFLLKSSVVVPRNITITCDVEIKRAAELTAPRDAVRQLDISIQGLELLVKEYESIVGDKFKVQRKVVEKFGDARAKYFPFAWAVCYIKKCVIDGCIDLSHNKTRTALMWLQTFRHVVDTWQNHPRFNSVAKDLGKPASFLHTSSQLIAAAYLYRAGNRIGLSLEDKPDQPNPDLYVRGSGKNSIFLEVKAPQALQWSDGFHPLTDGKIESTVKRCVQDSVDQIDKKHPGVLIISSSYTGLEFFNVFETCIKKALNSYGRARKGLVSVVGLSPVFSSNVSEFLFKFITVRNDYYDGDVSIVLDPADRQMGNYVETGTGHSGTTL